MPKETQQAVVELVDKAAEQISAQPAPKADELPLLKDETKPAEVETKQPEIATKSPEIVIKSPENATKPPMSVLPSRKLNLTEMADGVMAGVARMIGGNFYMKKIPGTLETMDLGAFLAEAEIYWNKAKEEKK
jgi:hypothetical protein